MPHVRRHDRLAEVKNSELEVSKWLAIILALLSVFGGCTGNQPAPEAADFLGEAGGCGNCFVYRFNEARTLAVTVQVDAASLRAKSNLATFHLDPVTASPRVQVLRFSTPARNYFCDDVDDGQHPVETWEAVAGRIEVQFYRSSEHVSGGEHLYGVSVELFEVELKSQKHHRTALLERVSIPQVQVGWFAG